MQFLKKLLPLIILTFLCINTAQADTDKYKQAENDAETILESVDKLIMIKQFDLAKALLLIGIDSVEKAVGENIIIARPLLLRLARFYQERETKYDESEKIFLYILKQDKDLLSYMVKNEDGNKNFIIEGWDKTLAQDYYNLGFNQHLQNDSQSAETYFLKAMDYLKPPFKDNDVAVCTLMMLDFIYFKQGKRDARNTLYLKNKELKAHYTTQGITNCNPIQE